MNRMRVCSGCFVFCLASVSQGLAADCASGIWYAKVSATGTGDCCSWANACTLSQALSDSFLSAEDQIWVQAGTYSPIFLQNGVKVIGGFNGTETSPSQSDPSANQTVIDGGGSVRGVVSSNDGPSTMLRGFRITNGYSDADEGGGGIYLNSSSAVIVQCVFDNNSAMWWGGAVAIHGSSSPNFVNCTFHDNGQTATVDTKAGAAIYLYSGSPTFTNCLFYNNKAGEGGAFANDSGTATFRNCTLVKNQATVGDGGALHDEDGWTTVRNSILWGNSAGRSGSQIFNSEVAVTTVSNSNVQGGWSGTGNINANPQFVNDASNDYKLLTSSPCKNSGQNAYLPPDTGDIDWDGNTGETLPKDLALAPRKLYSVVDMGAYEFAACIVHGDCASGEVCCAYSCVVGECCDNNDCTIPLKPLCRTSDHQCVRCLTGSDCASGVCNNGTCCVGPGCANQ